MTISACNGNKGTTQNNEQPNKTLVAYFSATGNTRAAAQMVAEATGADLLAIEPLEAYSAADLDWTDSLSRSSREMKNPDARPAMKPSDIDVAPYDTVYLGYPIWWYVAPRIINAFIDANNLSGKVVIPFATSGSSDIGRSVDELRKTYPQIDFRDGRLLNRASVDDVKSWIKEMKR